MTSEGSPAYPGPSTQPVRWLAAPRLLVASAGLVFLVALLVYANSLRGAFVFDDLWFVVKNPFIRDFDRLGDIFTSNLWAAGGPLGETSNYYRPLVNVLLLFQYQVFGPSPLGYHAVNVLLHGVVSVLVFVLALRVVPGRPSSTAPPFAGAIAAGMLFATHPIHTESVAWIMGMVDVWCAAFYVGALLCYSARDTWRSRLGATALLLCATLVKEVAFTLPAVFLAYDRVFRPSEPWRTRASRYTALALPLALSIALRVHALGDLAPNPVDVAMGPALGVLNAFALFARYLAKLVVPLDMSAIHVVHPLEAWGSARAVLSVAVGVGFAATSLVGQLRGRSWSVPLVLIASALAPVLYLPLLGRIFADRYLYVPSIGFVLLVGMLAQVSMARLWWPVPAVVVAAVTLACGAGTIARNPVWRDEFSLWSDVASKEEHPSAHRYVAYQLYFREGRREEALRHYALALRYDPGSANATSSALSQRGIDLMSQDRFEAALEHFQLAVGFSPERSDLHSNLGIALLQAGRLDEAISEFATAVRLDPTNEASRTNLDNARRQLRSAPGTQTRDRQ